MSPECEYALVRRIAFAVVGGWSAQRTLRAARRTVPAAGPTGTGKLERDGALAPPAPLT